MLAVHFGCSGYTTESTNRLAATKKAADEKLSSNYGAVTDGTMYKHDMSDANERETFIAPFRALHKIRARIAPIPPLDVAFCWSLHRLSPKDYAEDCMRISEGSSKQLQD